MTKTKSIANLLSLSLLLAASAVAGTTNKGTLKVSETVSVGGKQIAAGQYQLEWAGSGPNVELTISDGRTTVAKVPAQVLPLEKAGAASGYSTNSDQAGKKALTEIFFGGKKYQLSIGEASAEAATPSDSRPASN